MNGSALVERVESVRFLDLVAEQGWQKLAYPR